MKFSLSFLSVLFSLCLLLTLSPTVHSIHRPSSPLTNLHVSIHVAVDGNDQDPHTKDHHEENVPVPVVPPHNDISDSDDTNEIELGSSLTGQSRNSRGNSAGSCGSTIGSVTPSMLSSAASSYGWSCAQINDWVKLILQESGGSPIASNPKTHAFGIGQFLGATLTKYGPYGATSHNAADQLRAMAKYIADRYNNPSSAWRHEVNSHWY